MNIFATNNSNGKMLLKRGVTILETIMALTFSLFVVLLFAMSAKQKSDDYKSKDQREQSYIYQQLHQTPVCTATKIDSSGTPTSYLCKHVYVEADARLWGKIEGYKPTQQDIDATTFPMANKTITWSDDKITRKYKPEETKKYRGALDYIFGTGPQ